MAGSLGSGSSQHTSSTYPWPANVTRVSFKAMWQDLGRFKLKGVAGASNLIPVLEGVVQSVQSQRRAQCTRPATRLRKDVCMRLPCCQSTRWGGTPPGTFASPAKAKAKIETSHVCSGLEKVWPAFGSKGMLLGQLTVKWEFGVSSSVRRCQRPSCRRKSGQVVRNHDLIPRTSIMGHNTLLAVAIVCPDWMQVIRSNQAGHTPGRCRNLALIV